VSKVKILEEASTSGGFDVGFLAAAGMQVLDDGSHVQLAPTQHFYNAVAQLVQPERLPRLRQEQAEDVATRRSKKVRGAAQLFDRAHRGNICA
jgi:hypothetical protein